MSRQVSLESLQSKLAGHGGFSQFGSEKPSIDRVSRLWGCVKVSNILMVQTFSNLRADG
ncbi:hypothetical protein CY34DRAFT_802099 [Suillus luteus UH-Slu-Lm8-n1]|uniref:Uncharacterized protein n=1 Tax=Suillus luteus UH-Slu-Lm8-n1 TaxID=930992 RepID=A0A0D0ATK4_9AGAM|nr:hypothetical protein CY34DRAFT_802099 [Suillus luteus UH-Slu-Lm8-n1]